MSTDDAVTEAFAAELRTWDPEVRKRPELIGALIHPEFTEVVATGRRLDRETVLAMLADVEGASHDSEPAEMVGAELAPGVVHLTYATVSGQKRVRRSSIWRRSAPGPDGWRLYYHQATAG